MKSKPLHPVNDNRDNTYRSKAVYRIACYILLMTGTVSIVGAPCGSVASPPQQTGSQRQDPRRSPPLAAPDVQSPSSPQTKASISPWAQCTTAGVKARDQNNYPEAVNQFTRAARIAEKQGLLMRQVNSLEEVATTYIFAGDYLSAERILLESIKLLGTANSPTMASKLNSLGMVYMALNKDVAAERALRKAVNIFQTTPLRITDPVTSMNQLAICLQRQGKLDEAEKILKDALIRIKNANKLQSFEGINCDITLIDVLCSQKRFSDATEIASKLTLSNNPNESMVGWCMLARTNQLQKRFSESVACLEKSIEISKQCGHQENKMLATAWELTHSCVAGHEWKLAERAERLARALSNNHPNRYWLAEIAAQYLVNHRLDDAISHYAEAIALYDSAPRSERDERDLLRFLEFYTFALRQAKQQAKADQADLRIQLLRKNLGIIPVTPVKKT